MLNLKFLCMVLKFFLRLIENIRHAKAVSRAVTESSYSRAARRSAR